MSFACKCWNRFSNQPGNPLFACKVPGSLAAPCETRGQLSAQWPNKHWESWISISDQHSVKYLTSGKPQRKSSGLLVGCMAFPCNSYYRTPRGSWFHICHMHHQVHPLEVWPIHFWKDAMSQQCLLVVLLDSKLRHRLVTHHAFQSFLQCHKNLCCNAFSFLMRSELQLSSGM